MRRRAGAPAVIVVLLAACSAPTRRIGEREQRLHLTAAGEVMGPYVPAGTPFTVEVWDPISSETAQPGAQVLLNVRENLDAPDGTNVVRRGAFIHATVVRVAAAPNAALVLDLTTVRTMEGDVPIAARLASRAPSPDPTVYDLVLTSNGGPMHLRRGTRLALVLTEPLVPLGSTYR